MEMKMIPEENKLTRSNYNGVTFLLPVIVNLLWILLSSLSKKARVNKRINTTTIRYLSQMWR